MRLVPNFVFKALKLEQATIENSTIGAETPAAGAFSTLTAASLAFSGLTGITGTLQKYVATVTVANGQTTGKEAAIGIPTHFVPLFVAVHVTVAATNAVTLVDIGDDADTDTFCDGLTTPSLATTGFKGVFGCNGTRGIPSADTGSIGGLATADEVEVVISGDPGATGVTLRLTFFGIRVAAA